MQLPSVDRAIPRVATFVVGAWIVYLTLQPFAWDLAQVGPRLSEGLGTWDTDAWLQQVLVGVLFGWCVGGLSRIHRRRFLVVTLLFFVALEVAQAAVQYRHPRSVDLVIHLVGGMAGFALGSRTIGFATGTRSVRIARVLVVAGMLLPAWWTFDTASRTSLSTNLAG